VEPPQPGQFEPTQPAQPALLTGLPVVAPPVRLKETPP
jgi:hypothetical protein